METTPAPARVLVTGSTTWTDRGAVERALSERAALRDEVGGSFRVITGMADGADEIARTWAAANGRSCLAEPLSAGCYPAPMHAYNHEMLGWEPELVLAFKDNFASDWNSSSCDAGTEHMCRIAVAAGVPVVLNGEALVSPSPDIKELVDATGDTGSMTESLFQGVNVRVVQGDITTLDVDVIVNAANSSLLGGGGVDGAIHRAAGPALLDACRDVVARQGGCAPGEAVITSAGNLLAKHVVHTVGPVWTGNAPAEHDALLASCYSESLRLAAEAGAESVAFPNISTGVYRFPLERAAGVAVHAVRSWIADLSGDHDISDIAFVCFTEDNFALYTDLLA